MYTGSGFAQRIIAHRGASQNAPENTIAAIEEAVNQNADYLEIDVHLSKDGDIIVIHDSSVNRTTDGSGKVNALTTKEIKKLDAGSWFSNEFKGEKIPTLNEVFKEASSQIKIIIEFKYGNDKYPQIEEKAIKLIKEFNLEDRIILKAFDTKILDRFETLAPDIPRLYTFFGSWGFITIDNFIRFRSATDIKNVDYYQVHKYFITQSLINDVHSAGKKVIAWGVVPKDLDEMKKLGVDLVEVDWPEGYK